jgi:hypothetical protein
VEKSVLRNLCFVMALAAAAAAPLLAHARSFGRGGHALNGVGFGGLGHRGWSHHQTLYGAYGVIDGYGGFASDMPDYGCVKQILVPQNGRLTPTWTRIC